MVCGHTEIADSFGVFTRLSAFELNLPPLDPSFSDRTNGRTLACQPTAADHHMSSPGWHDLIGSIRDDVRRCLDEMTDGDADSSAKAKEKRKVLTKRARIGRSFLQW